MGLGHICSSQCQNTKQCPAAQPEQGLGQGEVSLVHDHGPTDTALMVMLSHGGGFHSKLYQAKCREGGKITLQPSPGNTDPCSCFWPEPDSHTNVSWWEGERLSIPALTQAQGGHRGPLPSSDGNQDKTAHCDHRKCHQGSRGTAGAQHGDAHLKRSLVVKPGQELMDIGMFQVEKVIFLPMG